MFSLSSVFYFDGAKVRFFIEIGIDYFFALFHIHPLNPLCNSRQNFIRYCADGLRHFYQLGVGAEDGYFVADAAVDAGDVDHTHIHIK